MHSNRHLLKVSCVNTYIFSNFHAFKYAFSRKIQPCTNISIYSISCILQKHKNQSCIYIYILQKNKINYHAFSMQFHPKKNKFHACIHAYQQIRIPVKTYQTQFLQSKDPLDTRSQVKIRWSFRYKIPVSCC